MIKNKGNTAIYLPESGTWQFDNLGNCVLTIGGKLVVSIEQNEDGYHVDLKPEWQMVKPHNPYPTLGEAIDAVEDCRKK